MKINSIKTDLAPLAIGPYSQAVSFGNMLFVSGQLPVNPNSGLIDVFDIESQTRQALNNIKNILLAAGSDLNKVIKTTVYMKDLNDFALMNNIYAQFFTSDVLPARVAVEVSKLPKESFIEIDVIAVI